METKTPKACLSVALCTCKIVTLKVEELRSARKNMEAQKRDRKLKPIYQIETIRYSAKP